MFKKNVKNFKLKMLISIMIYLIALLLFWLVPYVVIGTVLTYWLYLALNYQAVFKIKL